MYGGLWVKKDSSGERRGDGELEEGQSRKDNLSAAH